MIHFLDTDEGYEEVKRNNPNAQVYMNGVGNSKGDFVEGLAAGTLTEDEMRRIGRGETVERVGVFNPKEYFDKEKYNPTINKGVDENDKK